jgi:hypothetical protein
MSTGRWRSGGAAWEASSAREGADGDKPGGRQDYQTHEMMSWYVEFQFYTNFDRAARRAAIPTSGRTTSGIVETRKNF